MSPIERVRALISRLSPSGSVGERVAKSIVWLAGQNVTSRVLQLSMLVILARLIGPRELGIVGIGLLGLSAMRKFTNIGLNAALIQKEQADVDSHLNTTWVLEIARGLLIGVVLFLAAPVLATTVFGEPAATWPIRAIALSPVILAFQNPGLVYFQKNLDFHKEFAYKIVGDGAQFAVSVGWALVSPDAWSFVAGFLAADVLRLFISYLIHDYRPWPEFDLEIAKELVGYGKWLTGSSILYFLYSEGDDAFVGWFLNPTMLAFYQYTYRFANAPATEISGIVESVMFPAFSKLQGNMPSFRRAYLKTLRMTALFAFPASVGIAVVTPTFIMAFFGEEWMVAVPAMQVLAIYGLLRAIGRTFSPVWKAVGRPDYITKLSALRVVLMAIIIYPLTARYGITGTALAITIIFVFPMMPLDILITARELEMRVTDILYEFLYPGLASIFMGVGVWYVQTQLPFGSLLNFVLLVGAGTVLYAIAVVVLESLFGWEIRRNFGRMLESLSPDPSE
ncbi:polysaccharide transporter, PST family [Halogranum gelatinilyticum]|uniref:Polysaccharide transporter, PST family n=1 Tax=Halogranum gelatinilyticum TaxID=660521 RepID=A0A1G9UMX8_9EURY|nr:lipopolysaccharide biosynthesis protein [Halogranum gelatinilyticum]SDM61268.1 polysaccharide transporter, PST family [Halogranum gelatinilyticum]